MANELQIQLDAIKLDKDTNLLPENLKAGITCLGVKGTYEGGSNTNNIHLFETVEEMNNSTDNSENDLAVVYKNEVQNWEGTSPITTLTFPSTVVLSEAVPEDAKYSCDTEYYSDTAYVFITGTISSTSASFRVRASGLYRITYTSEDGLTYTRTDSNDKTITLSDSAITLGVYGWDDVCGNFMLSVITTFDGLYQYDGTTYNVAPTQLTLNNSNQLLPNKIGYGNNGIVTGGESIYDNLDWNIIMKKYNILGNIELYVYDELDTSIITYTPYVASKNYIYQTKKFDAEGNDFITIDDDVVYSEVGETSIKISSNEMLAFTLGRATDDTTTRAIYITKYTLIDNKVYVSLYDTQEVDNGSFFYTAYSWSDESFTEIIKYNQNDNCVYYTFIDDNYYMSLVKYDITNKTFTKLFTSTVKYQYAKYNIDFTNSLLYLDSSSSGTFDKYTFSGVRTTIKSHSGYSSGANYSDIYIGVKNGSNSNAILYNMQTKSFTDIVIPSQSDWYLYTYNDITYIIYKNTSSSTNYTLTTIKNNKIVSTSDVDITYASSTPTTIKNSFYGNVANITFDDKLIVPNYIIDMSENKAYYIDSCLSYSNIFYIYFNWENLSWVAVDGRYKSIINRLSTGYYLDGSGTYLAIKTTNKSNSYTAFTLCKAQSDYLDEHYNLDNYSDIILPT